MRRRGLRRTTALLGTATVLTAVAMPPATSFEPDGPTAPDAAVGATSVEGHKSGKAAPKAAGDDDLPDYGYPYRLSEDPAVPQDLAEFRESEPTCPAPPLPAATDAGDPEGYTLPVRIKLTNGIMLAGYTPEGARRGQKVPFAVSTGKLTGWIVARLKMPSLKLKVRPADVLICGGQLRNSGPAQRMASQADADSYALTGQDGTRYLPYPGTLSQRGIVAPSPVGNFIVHAVAATVAGVNADGSLELRTDLSMSQSLQATSPVFRCVPRVTGTMSSAAKQIVTPERKPFPFEPTFTPGVPPRADKVYLPTRQLDGAVEGGKATIGSNWLDVRIPYDASVRGSRCGGAVNRIFSGYNKSGLENFTTGAEGGVPIDEADPAAGRLPATPIAAIPDGYPITRGLTDFSVDIAIDKLGLPTGLPSGYGFE